MNLLKSEWIKVTTTKSAYWLYGIGILLAIGMGLLGMGYIAQKNKTRKVGGVLLLAFALLQLIVGLMEIRSAAM